MKKVLSIEEQGKNTLETCERLIGLIKLDYNLVITRGNGPQVENILVRNEAGYNLFKIPKIAP
jgi:carbamate kinase